MTAITASEARANLYRLIDEAASSHQQLLITGKRNKAVLFWRKTGWQSRKRCICCPSLVCVNLSAKAWTHPSTNALRIRAGELAGRNWSRAPMQGQGAVCVVPAHAGIHPIQPAGGSGYKAAVERRMAVLARKWKFMHHRCWK